MRTVQPQHSVSVPIINPNGVDETLLERMHIDVGMRAVVASLLIHGYDTRFSCEGHGKKEPYLAFKRGTGDGSFEKTADRTYGLHEKRQSTCCLSESDVFCRACSASKDLKVFRAERHRPFSFYAGCS